MRALLLVDIQNDFLPGGALPVAEGNGILPVVNTLLKKPFDVIVASKDWHPVDHGSFASTHVKNIGERIQLAGLDQILWPTHCVEGTEGAEFAAGWDSFKVHEVFFKGTDKEVDSYSTFFDNGHRRTTGLEAFLREKGITDLYIAGLATDYCVKYSVLDALKMGFQVYVVTDAVRGVNLASGDSDAALKEMQDSGAKLVRAAEV